MDVDRRLGLVVTCLVLTAGCNAVPFGGVASSDRVETLTPVPMTDTAPAERQTESERPLPPGVYANGTVRVAELRSAHATSLEGRTYTWVYSRGEIANGTRTPAFTRRVRVGENAVLISDVDGDSGTGRSLYLTRGKDYERQVTDNTTRVSAIDSGYDHEYAPDGELIGAFLPDRRVRVRTIERDGRVLYRLYVPPGIPPDGSGTIGADLWTVRNYRVTVYVTPGGRVRTASVRYETNLPTGETERSYFRFEYRAVGETPLQRPAWVPETTRTAPVPDAENETGQRERTRTGTGTA